MWSMHVRATVIAERGSRGMWRKVFSDGERQDLEKLFAGQGFRAISPLGSRLDGAHLALPSSHFTARLAPRRRSPRTTVHYRASWKITPSV